MTHGTTHTIAGFTADGIVIAATALIHLADVSEVIAILAASISMVTAGVRLYFLLKKGGRDE